MNRFPLGLVRAWRFTAILAVGVLAGMQQTSIAGSPASEMTQAEYLQWLVQARGERSTLPETVTSADYVSWARQHGIEPQGGWQPNAPLTRDAFAQTLSQLYGLPQSSDPVRSLQTEGVTVPDEQRPGRAAVLKTVGDFGFASKTAKLARDPGTPTEPNDKIIICHHGHGGDNPRTIRISSRALDAHLAHGDTIGPCPSSD